MLRYLRTLEAAALALVLLAPCSPCQDINEIRDQLRRDLKEIGFAQSLFSLVLLSDELELSSATYYLDNDVDTRVSSFALPFHTTLPAFGEEAPGLYLEGVLGYARARESTKDIYSGGAPGLETSIDTTWTTYGGLLGAGLEFAFTEELSFTPILNAGLARIENETDYGGPGAPLTAAIFDGIAFNWDALVLSGGTAARIDWLHALDDSHDLELLGRYDLRWAKSVQADDEAQEFTTRSQLLTFKADVTGPTGLAMFQQELRWRASLGYRWFLEGDLFDTNGYAQLGGALELDTRNVLPIGKQAALSGAVMLGEGFWGWTIGVSISF